MQYAYKFKSTKNRVKPFTTNNRFKWYIKIIIIVIIYRLPHVKRSSRLAMVMRVHVDNNIVIKNTIDYLYILYIYHKFTNMLKCIIGIYAYIYFAKRFVWLKTKTTNTFSGHAKNRDRRTRPR